MLSEADRTFGADPRSIGPDVAKLKFLQMQKSLEANVDAKFSKDDIDSCKKTFSKLKLKWQQLEMKSKFLEHLSVAETLEPTSDLAKLQKEVTDGKKALLAVKKETTAVKAAIKELIGQLTAGWAQFEEQFEHASRSFDALSWNKFHDLLESVAQADKENASSTLPPLDPEQLRMGTAEACNAVLDKQLRVLAQLQDERQAAQDELSSLKWETLPAADKMRQIAEEVLLL
jgi:hypothetical protein